MLHHFCKKGVFQWDYDSHDCDYMLMHPTIGLLMSLSENYVNQYASEHNMTIMDALWAMVAEVILVHYARVNGIGERATLKKIFNKTV